MEQSWVFPRSSQESFALECYPQWALSVCITRDSCDKDPQSQNALKDISEAEVRARNNLVADLDSGVCLKGDQWFFFFPPPLQGYFCFSGLNLTLEWELKLCTDDSLPGPGPWASLTFILLLISSIQVLPSRTSLPVSLLFKTTLRTFLFQALLCFPGPQGLSSPSAVCVQKPSRCLLISKSYLGLPGGFGMRPLSNSGIISLYSCPVAGFCQRSEVQFWTSTQRLPVWQNLSHLQHFGMNLLKYMMNSQHKFLIRP